ncbi:MAG: carbohydrate binding family 9 domain-containing protein, partial [Acidobacteriota bacterium]
MSPLLAQEADPPSVQAVQVKQEPVLDGVLDEPVWKEASPVGQFRQRNPQEGNPATEQTEVRIIYTETAIFFGVTCYDSQPDRIIATQRARDADLEFDDSFTILLDTFHSHRNAFWFEMNPLGARFDSWITDEGGRTSPEWDERWEV